MIVRRLALALLLLLMAVPANAACYQWSRTTSANATADPTINWSVGMAPAAVDASGRAMMARTAECRDDTSGLLVAGGTSTAYTLLTYQGLGTTPVDGQLLAFTVSITNGLNPTLQIDGQAAYPFGTSTGAGVSAGVLVAGSVYTVKFSTANGVWMLRDFYGAPTGIPIGAMLPYFGSTAPNANFILPYGQCISRTTYATYFSQVGTRFSVCDGSNTFGAPDLRGKTIFAIDNLGGSTAGNLTTTYFGSDPTVIGNSGGNKSHAITALESAVLSYTPLVSDPGHRHTWTVGISNPSILSDTAAGATANAANGGGAGFRSPIATYPMDTAATGITVSVTANAGGQAMSLIPPAMVMTYILRVL